MSKYINILLLSFFGILSINYNFGLTFYIPYVCYYCYKNFKNILLIIPLSFFSVYIFDLNCYIELLILYISLIILLLIKKNKVLLFVLYSFIITLVTYLLIENISYNSFNINIIFIMLSPIILLYLIYNNKTSNKNDIRIRSIVYNEILLALILSVGSLNYKIVNVPISLVISAYFAMYFSNNNYHICSIIYSIICAYFLYEFQNLNYSIIIVIISLIYILPKLYSSVIFSILLMYSYFIYQNVIPIEAYIILLIVMIIFGLLRITINREISDDEIINNIYEKTVNQVDVEIESFSLFLDKMSSNIENNEYNTELGNQIIKLSNVVCGKCNRRIECYKKNKGSLYYYFKNSIIGNDTSFICEHNNEINRVGRQLGNNLLNKKAYASDMLLPILNGVSSILKNYTVDHNVDIELDLNIFKKIKKGLIDYGYSLSVYNVVKTFKFDYIIEIGIIGICYFEEKENIENVISYYMGFPSSTVLKEIKKNKTYITIVPKVNYEVTYGYGSISKVGNNICGDNYWVKSIANNKIVAAICDGMGKGLNASIISTRTLKLLEELLSSNISSETSISILNTLYYIQDYLENYTTLDYVEINKHTGEMTLYKAGATYTYIVHYDGNIEKIENDNLPFGLNELILSKKINLQDGDLIMLASDGIFDNIIDVEDLENYILNIKNLEPQKISYEILNYARKTDVISKDDMSVITLKVKLV